MNKIIPSGNSFVQNILQKVLTDTKVRRRHGLNKMTKFWGKYLFTIDTTSTYEPSANTKKKLISEILETTFWLLFCL